MRDVMRSTMAPSRSPPDDVAMRVAAACSRCEAAFIPDTAIGSTLDIATRYSLLATRRSSSSLNQGLSLRPPRIYIQDMKELFTIGYEKAKPAAVMDEITGAKIDVLVDVRAVT